MINPLFSIPNDNGQNNVGQRKDEVLIIDQDIQQLLCAIQVNQLNQPKSYFENCLCSDVILIGEVEEITNADDQEFDHSINKIKVLEVLRGEDFIKDDTVTVNVLSVKRNNLTTSDSTVTGEGEKRVYFLNMLSKNENQYIYQSSSESLIKGEKIYSNSGKILIGDLKTEIKKMKKVIEVNDPRNSDK